MKLRTTETFNYTLIEILADNEQPGNPIARTEYETVEFPEVDGTLLVVSGMPMSAACLVALHYKNMFGAIAIANPREGIAEVVHTTTREYRLGSATPLI